VRFSRERSGYPECVSETEGEKERTDRQLIELLTELRVVLPGAQVLLAFLFTVPFAARFGGITRPQRVGSFTSLLFTATGTVLLMAPSIYDSTPPHARPGLPCRGTSEGKNRRGGNVVWTAAKVTQPCRLHDTRLPIPAA
jgi:hypothetical protein